MASEIKVEVDQISSQCLCHGCLSQDRKLKPLTGINDKVFTSLIASGMLYSGSEERMICWECEAILRRVMKFQAQICQAQNKLMEMFYNMSLNIQSLSNLSTTTKDHYDLYYECIEQAFTQTDSFKPNEYIPEKVPDSKPTTELQLIKNCTVKIENLKSEPETSQYSDCEEDNSKFENTDCIIEKNEPQKKNGKLKNGRTIKYHLKYATIKDLTSQFTNINWHFVEEFLDLEQVQEFLIEPEQSQHWFRCKQCKLSLNNKTLYLLHQNLAHIQPDSSTTCLLCKKKLPDLEKLRTHWKLKHCAYWRCILCNSYCRKAGRLKHLKFQHSKVYCCMKCRGEFRCKRHFNQHFKKEHDTYICHHCNKVYNAKSTLIKHLISSHTKEHECKQCNKKFKLRKNLLRHLNGFHPDAIDKKVDIEAAYCVECNKQYKTVDLYKRHLYDSVKHNHRPPQSIPCPECGKIFSRKTYMKNHLYQSHMREKAKWKCTICDKYFANNYGLKLHHKRVHLRLPKEKNIICDICGRGFHTNRILTNHRRTHTGERPFQCDYCLASFAQKTALVSHQKSQHKDMMQLILNQK